VPWGEQIKEKIEDDEDGMPEDGHAENEVGIEVLNLVLVLESLFFILSWFDY